jgi:hypothetical protein
MEDHQEGLAEILEIDDYLNKALKGIALVGIGKIPVFGDLLAGIAAALWPDGSNSGPTWEDIENRIKTLCKELIDENNAKKMRDQTQGLYNVMKLYRETTQRPQKGQYFTTLIGLLASSEPIYFNNEAPWTNLAYFVSAGTLHLTMLREQHLFFKDIYGEDDADAAVHKTHLEQKVWAYEAAREKAIKECLEWRKKRITSTWIKRDEGYYKNNEVVLSDPDRNISERFSWSQVTPGPEAAYRVALRQLEMYVTTSYHAGLEKVVEASYSWPLFAPSTREKNIEQMFKPTMIYPGWIGTGYRTWYKDQTKFFWDNREFAAQHGLITKIVTHHGDRIDGMEIWYGGQSPDDRPPPTGRTSVWNIPSGCRIKTFESWPKGRELDQASNMSVSGLRMAWKHDNGDNGTIGGFDVGKHIGESVLYDEMNYGRKGEDAPHLLWMAGWSIIEGGTGYVSRLFPAFGYRECWGPLK